MSKVNSNRIAKNTLLLYFRMLIIMGVNLYTVRVVLDVLGIVDYGIYNVIGGIVTMFTFISNTMAGSCQRFFSFELGKEDYLLLKRIFSLSLIIFTGIILLFLFLAETVGLWFVNTHLVIPEDRLIAANWVYQFSILSFIVTMLSVPYNALIIAHEKMNIFAYISIVEAILKLLIVYLLKIFLWDKLALYGLLSFMVSALIGLIYKFYCNKKYKESHFKWYWQKDIFKELVTFSGWNLLGTLASVLRNQGINILLNIFFGPIVNTARGIAFQINNVINSFVTNFYTAVRPQITKFYAMEKKDEMLKLIFQSSKFGYFLILLISIPAFLETPFLLNIWLKSVPEHTILFTRIIIINILVDSLSYPLITAALATGKVKQIQSIMSGALLLNLPVSYVFLKLGYGPESTMYISVLVSVLCQFLRVHVLNNLIQMSKSDYFFKVILRILLLTLISIIIPFFFYNLMSTSFIRVFFVGMSACLFTTVGMYVVGLDNTERSWIKIFIKSKFSKQSSTNK